jgi:hypothetical protein
MLKELATFTLGALTVAACTTKQGRSISSKAASLVEDYLKKEIQKRGTSNDNTSVCNNE